MFVPVAASAAPEVAAVDSAPRARRRVRPAAFVPYLYVLPGVVMLLLWTYSPLVQTLQLSFFDWNLIPTSPRTFVGVENYIDVVQLPELQRAIGNTGVYIAAFLVFSLVLPVVIALVSKQVQGRMRSFYQALIFVPFLITPVATSAVWRWILADEGIVAGVLASTGIDLPNVFRDPALAIWAVILIVGWQMLGFGVLVVAAGIAGISPEYAQAAQLDGADDQRTDERSGQRGF